MEAQLPDLPGALALLRAHGVPDNVVRHSLAVAAVAEHLAQRLREGGFPVDPLLAHRGGLLHDLDKLSSEKPADHGMKTGQILRDRGWPELAAIAERHALLAQPRTWEEKLVHYADKIVDEDRVVCLAERLETLKRRYPAHRKEIERAVPFLLALQTEIAQALGLSTEELHAELLRLDHASR